MFSNLSKTSEMALVGCASIGFKGIPAIKTFLVYQE